MKSSFFLMAGLFVAAATMGYFVWLTLRAAYSVLRDWRMTRELDDLRAQGQLRRQRREEEDRRRLDNGCDHVFDECFGTFPPGVCSKCGLARQRPPGPCDHVWRAESGPTVGSVCEKCGKKYRAL